MEGFCHSVCILESLNQSRLLSNKVKSYVQSNFARAVRISIHPKLGIVSGYLTIVINDTHLRPIHPRGPIENGCEAAKSSLVVVESHRSGLNVKGSLKFDGSRLAPIGLVDTTVYSRNQESQGSENVCICTYSLRKPVPVHRVSALRHQPRQRKW